MSSVPPRFPQSVYRAEKRSTRSFLESLPGALIRWPATTCGTVGPLAAIPSMWAEGTLEGPQTDGKVLPESRSWVERQAGQPKRQRHVLPRTFIATFHYG